MTKRLPLLILIILTSLQIFADDPKDHATLFQQGFNAFEKGDFHQAKQNFSALTKDAKWQFPAFYNLGNIAVRQKKLGEAAGYFRLALGRNPIDRDTRYNLEFVLNGLGIRKFPGAKGSWELFRATILNLFTLDQALIGTFIVAFFFLFNVYKYFKKKKIAQFNDEKIPPQPAVIMFIWGVLLLFVGFSTLAKVYDASVERGTVIASKVELRSGPAESNTSLSELSEGYEVLVLEEMNEWRQVSALDGSRVGITGWVPAASLMITSGGGQ